MKFEIKIDYEKKVMALIRDQQLVQERSFIDKEDAKRQGRDFARIIACSSLPPAR